MRRRTFIITAAAAALSAPSLLAGGKAKKAKASFTVHFETGAEENPKMIMQLQAGGRQRYFRRTPEVSLKDCVCYNPFPDAVGSYGAVFYLKPNAAKRFAALTNVAQGSWMLSVVNGRPVDSLLIDTQIDDGKIVVWKGIFLPDIELLDKSLPRFGEKEKKKKWFQ